MHLLYERTSGLECAFRSTDGATADAPCCHRLSATTGNSHCGARAALLAGEVGCNHVSLEREEHVQGLLGLVRSGFVLENDLPFFAPLTIDLLESGWLDRQP